MTNVRSELSVMSAALVSVLLCCPSLAQTDDLGSLEWFQEYWENAAQWAPPDLTYVEYTIETFFDVSQAEVDELWDDVKDAPFHPKRAEYERKKEQLEWGGSVETTVRAWWTADGWRISRDTPRDSRRTFQDTVVRGDIAWRRTPNAMVIADPGNPGNRFDHDNEGYALRKTLFQCVLGYVGFSASTPIPYAPVSSSVSSDGTWSGEIRNHDGSRSGVFRGRFLGSELQVDEFEMIRTGGMPVVFDKKRRFLDWRYDSHFGRMVAHTLEQYDDQGMLRARIGLRVAREFLPGTSFDDLTRLPEEGGHQDPLRMAAPASVVTDARPAQRTITLRRGDEREVMAMPGPHSAGIHTRYRFLGWAMFIAVVCASLWYWMRNRS